MAESLRIASRLAQAGCEVDPTTGALTPPIHTSSTFEREPDLEYPRGFTYSRANNPTRALLEREVASLEGGLEGVAFASGMAAVSGVLQGLLASGSHVLLADDAYHGVRHLLSTVYQRFSVTVTSVDFTDIDHVHRALSQKASGSTPSLVWLETPSNPMLKLTDIAAVAALCTKYAVPCVVDATWCTPLLLRPLQLGADIVLHSTTKYLGGHSDLIGGIAVFAARAAPLLRSVREVQQLGGAVPSPFDCWLTLRGMRSLGARMPLHCANALALARSLEAHPMVHAVHYPGLESHPQAELARRSMADGCGGMLSFQVRMIAALCRETAACLRAPTLPPHAQLEGPALSGCPHTVRFVVGAVLQWPWWRAPLYASARRASAEQRPSSSTARASRRRRRRRPAI